MQLRKNRLWAALWRQRALAYESSDGILRKRTSADLSKLPPRPLVAELLRTSATLQDAVRRWRVVAPFREEEAARAGRPATEREERALRLRLGDRILKVVQSGGLVAVEKELSGWAFDTLISNGVTTMAEADEWLLKGHDHESPAARVLFDAHEILRPLVVAFRDPVRFFKECVPAIDFSFLPRSEISDEIRDPLRLFVPAMIVSRALHIWGPGALLNPKLRNLFDGLTPKEMAFALAAADQRPPYREGRARGRSDSTPRARRVDPAAEEAEVRRLTKAFEERRGESWGAPTRALREQAARNKVSTSAIKKRISRGKRKK